MVNFSSDHDNGLQKIYDTKRHHLGHRHCRCRWRRCRRHKIETAGRKIYINQIYISRNQKTKRRPQNSRILRASSSCARSYVCEKRKETKSNCDNYCVLKCYLDCIETPLVNFSFSIIFIWSVNRSHSMLSVICAVYRHRSTKCGK